MGSEMCIRDRLGSGGAIAKVGTGNELIKACADAVKTMDGGNSNSEFGIGYCLGLTKGVRQALIIVDEDVPQLGKICFPDEISNGQGMRIVLKYLQDNPDKLQQIDSVLAYAAYRAAYRCK